MLRYIGSVFLLSMAMHLVDGQNAITGKVIKEGNEITSGDCIATGADVSFWAGNKIILQPGFRVQRGARFYAGVFTSWGRPLISPD